MNGRIVQFPSTFAIGTFAVVGCWVQLEYRGIDDDRWPPAGDPTVDGGFAVSSGEARGEVLVPAGLCLCVFLALDTTVPGSFSALATLQPDDVQILSLTRANFTISDFQAIGHLRGLRKIELDYSAVTDPDLTVLAHLPDLEWVDLSVTPVCDQGLAQLGSAHSLRVILLALAPRFTGEAFRHWNNLNNLAVLDLFDTNVRDESVAHLQPLQSLQLLNLSSTPITDVGIGYVSQLLSLRELRLSGTSITDASVPYLFRLQNLRRLLITGTDISQSGYDDLTNALPHCVVEWSARDH